MPSSSETSRAPAELALRRAPGSMHRADDVAEPRLAVRRLLFDAGGAAAGGVQVVDARRDAGADVVRPAVVADGREHRRDRRRRRRRSRAVALRRRRSPSPRRAPSARGRSRRRRPRARSPGARRRRCRTAATRGSCRGCGSSRRGTPRRTSSRSRTARAAGTAIPRSRAPGTRRSRRRRTTRRSPAPCPAPRARSRCRRRSPPRRSRDRFIDVCTSACAARWKTTSASTVNGSRMSCSSSVAAGFRFSRLPDAKLSTTVTSSPRARSASTRFDPMKPAPPVTTARMEAVD